jgi:hypothetical protein
VLLVETVPEIGLSCVEKVMVDGVGIRVLDGVENRRFVCEDLFSC